MAIPNHSNRQFSFWCFRLAPDKGQANNGFNLPDPELYVKPGPDAPGYGGAAVPSRNALPSARNAVQLLLHAWPPAAVAGAPKLHASQLSRNASHLSAGAGTPGLHASHQTRNALPSAAGAAAPSRNAFP